MNRLLLNIGQNYRIKSRQYHYANGMGANMASVNKKKKGINSYLTKLGHKLDGKIRRIQFYTKRDRKSSQKPIRDFINGKIDY